MDEWKETVLGTWQLDLEKLPLLCFDVYKLPPGWSPSYYPVWIWQLTILSLENYWLCTEAYKKAARGFEMLSRRGKPLGPTILIVFLLLLTGYGYYLYNEQYSKFIESEGKLGLVRKKQLSLKSQLHGKLLLQLKVYGNIIDNDFCHFWGLYVPFVGSMSLLSRL